MSSNLTLTKFGLQSNHMPLIKLLEMTKNMIAATSIVEMSKNMIAPTIKFLVHELKT